MKSLRVSASLRLLAASILFAFPALAAAFDQRLVGTWQSSFDTDAGSFQATWIVAGDGKYEVRTTNGSLNTRETGVLTAEGGRWSKQSSTGSDGGPYWVERSDRLTLSGAAGTLVWTRAATAATAGATSKGKSPDNSATRSSNSPAGSGSTADSQAAFEQGSRLYKAGDKQGSFPHFLRAAQQGHVEAQLQAGWHYENGVGVARDDAQAAAWYEKAALGGNAIAMKNIGQMCEDGKGVKQDWLTAASWYRKSADAGESSGEFALARAYRFGIGVHQNRAEAIRWYKIAAGHGEAEAADDARWLSDPTNNVGFRNKEEHRLVIANQLRFSGHLLGADPAGIRFRNATERTNWLTGLRGAVDKDEDEIRRQMAIESAKSREKEKQRSDAVQGLIDQGYSRSQAEVKVPRP